MDIKPFHFKLQKILPKEQKALEALFEFLPNIGIREKFNEAITSALDEHLGIKSKYKLESVHIEDFRSFKNRVPNPATLILLGISPQEEKITIDMDSNLANFMIERLLGGTISTLPAPKPLSDIEQGVLQYLILQVLSRIFRLCNNESRLHFRFEKFLFNPDELDKTISQDKMVFTLVIKISLETNVGFVRIVFPSPLVEAMYLEVDGLNEDRNAEKQYKLKQLSRFNHIKFPIWAEGGSTTIAAGDIHNLETGDVIILENTKMKLEDEKLSGDVILRAGDGKHGGFVAEITPKKTKVHCKIVDLHKGEDIL